MNMQKRELEENWLTPDSPRNDCQILGVLDIEAQSISKQEHAHLQKTDSNRESRAGAAQWPFALCDGPRIVLKFTEQIGQYHVTLVYWLQKPTLVTCTSYDDPSMTSNIT